MRLFAPSLAFVDLETTGTTAAVDAITEIGIVRVDADPEGVAPPVGDRVVLARQSWRSDSAGHPGADRHHRRDGARCARLSLPSPPKSRPHGGRLVRRAQRALRLRLPQARVRAPRPRVHGARAVHGATVAAPVSGGRPAQPRQRDRAPRAGVSGRHRALGDARALWAFVQALYRDLRRETIEHAAKRVLQTPSLPPQLPPDALDALPEAPGVYLFYGLNPLPLYIGKSSNLRERVGAHFSSDYRSRDGPAAVGGNPPHRIRGDGRRNRRAAARIGAGEVDCCPRTTTRCGARPSRACSNCRTTPGPPRFVAAAASSRRELAGRYGPFSSKRQARETLRHLAAEHALCWKALGLEKRPGPASHARSGAAPARASARSRRTRITRGSPQRCAPLRAIPPWPFAGLAAIRERPAVRRAHRRARAARLVLARHRAATRASSARLIEAPPRPVFDADIAELLIRTLARGRHDVPCALR